MAADSVGQIGLDLVVNKGTFEKQMTGIQALAKKAGASLAAAFAVKKIVDFGAKCVELGSDLAEVQNVVDVVFPRMNQKINEFAKNSAAQFGLSETMAKKFTGTFGAMAKAFGFGEQQAYEMGTTLTGLAGDVASFYNISQDEAYTKLKSVFTGETESLKDLGIVMTQTALDSYALANGFGKTTAKMSEAEKVALRYKFVQDQLTSAAGDFSRTSDGWANQVRILKLQFDSLRATIGQGLINVLSPVLKVINTIIGKLMTLANAFKAFTELISGKKSSGGGVSAAAAGMEAVAAASDKAGSAASGAGTAAKKAAKDMKGMSTGIDELNIINPSDSSGSGNSGGGAGGDYGAEDIDMGSLAEGTDEIDSRLDSIQKKINELRQSFMNGFWSGFGDIAVFDDVQRSVDGIRESVKSIFGDPEVKRSADEFAATAANSLGKIAGSFGSIGMSIADNLLGGLNRYLQQNTDRIRGYIVSMFDIVGDISGIAGNLSAAVAEIFTVLRSGSGQQITADLIGIFSDAFMGVTALAGSFGRDVLDLIATPIINNQEKIKSAFQGILDVVQTVTSAIRTTFAGLIDSVQKKYDESISPLLKSFSDGISKLAEVFLDTFQANILPVLQNAADRFADFTTSTLQPLIDKFLEFAGKITECIQEVWEKVLQPFLAWFIANVAPKIASHLGKAIDAFFNFLTNVGNVISGVLDIFNGLLDFLLGVFTLDWERAWSGVKQMLSGAWTAMKALVTTMVEAIRSIIELTLDRIKNKWTITWNAVKAFGETCWNAIKALVESIFTAISNKIAEVWNSVKSKTEQIWSGIRTTVSTITEGIRDKITAIMTAIKSGISTALDGIKDKWTSVWSGLKEKTISIFDDIWSGIRGAINSILSGVEKMANGVVKGVNKMIDALNNLSFDVPDWVPGIGGESFGLDIPNMSTVKLPRLAQGGFVRANTPQLAMIGDNRHYGEIVAPEDRMQAMVDRAVALASGNNMSDQYLALMVDLLKQIINLIEAMDLTVKIDVRDIKKKLTELDKRTGYTLKTT
ncbi:hypothetical protein KH141_03970 [butyrate-producing bacterium]|jgi:phage-related protein|nr:hypothetical protein [butyrate-producing bacterium]